MAASTSSENAEQIAFWNSEAAQRWIAGQVALDRAMEPFGRAVLDRAGVRPGERAVDVGCGCGPLTLQLGDAVTSTGSVIGLDVSEPMLAVARDRARGRVHISFELGDAAAWKSPQPVDLIASRFGVMFFADPVRAFSNLAGLLRPGGRIAFVCWRALEQNPWTSVPLAAAATIIPPGPPTPPHAPGPFAFADRDRVHGILERAGFVDRAVEPFDADVVMATPEGGLEQSLQFAVTLGPVARLLNGVSDDVRRRVTDAVRGVLAPRVTAAGLRLPGAVWLASARRL
jgi:SAM-dependent methyltransferase